MVREATPSRIPPSQLASLVLGAMGPTRHLVLVLDYDGTLVPIESRPHLARADAGLAELLDRLAAHPRVWVTVVSGRGLDDLRDVLGSTGRLSLFAEHGGVVAWPDGTVASLSKLSEDEDLSRVRERLRGLNWPDGVWIEEKQLAVAVHTRGTPRAAAFLARELLQDTMREIDPLERLHILEGKEVLEVRPQGLHKGLVIDRLRDRLAGVDPTLVCAGDDRTDEDVFGRLEPGDFGVRVGEDGEATRATYRLLDPGEVRSFLQGLGAGLTYPPKGGA